jgi:hypothetical protein
MGSTEKGLVVVEKLIQRSEVLAWFAKLAPCLVGIEILRDVELLGAGIEQAWAPGQVDPSGVSEALRAATEERPGRCGGNL